MLSRKVFDSGAKKVRGDSGAAISSALAGAMTAIFVANLNLRSFASGAWALRTQARINGIRDRVPEKHADALRQAVSLQPALPDPEQPTLL
jgi:hypothetical protein